MGIRILLVFLAGAVLVQGAKKDVGCLLESWELRCNVRYNEWVEITSVAPDSTCGPVDACVDTARINTTLANRCSQKSSCRVTTADLKEEGNTCAAVVFFNCIPGGKTTARVPETTAKPEGHWHNDYDSWQWAIIWIIIGVVVVALIILIIMLINRCCFKALNKEKPKFVEATPTQSNLNSGMNSRSVSMSTLHRPPPVKKDVSQEEIDEVRAHFGTNKKKKDKEKYFGQGMGSMDSRGSKENGDAKYIMGDDSSSGIGGSTIETRLKNPLYDVTDTCHDDYVSFTMKKQAKSPLVNPNAYNTLNNGKKVDEDLYKKDAPTVDIHEDQREENFRLDINSWDINQHQRPQQQQNGQLPQNGHVANQQQEDKPTANQIIEEEEPDQLTQEEENNQTESPEENNLSQKVENEKCNGHAPSANIDVEAGVNAD